jgi:hypothetical protein
MTSTNKIEIAFIWLSPIPFLLTIVVPVAINIIFDYSNDLRPAIIWMTQIGVAISAILTPIGFYLTRKVAPSHSPRNRLLLGLATLLASFPAVIILATFSLLRALPFVLEFSNPLGIPAVLGTAVPLLFR